MRPEQAGSDRRLLATLGLLAIVILASVIRLIHLANRGHYYVLSQDSHFFHWQAGRALAGDAVPMAWHGGLTYPLAFGARAISVVSGMTEADALVLAGKLLPPAIGVAGMVMLYWGVGRMYDRRAAAGAAFIWAVLGYVYWTQAAGYLDRDGLSMVLLTAGVLLFHLSRNWHQKVGGIDVGWAIGGLAVMGVMALLVVEWLWLGAVLLLVVLTAAVCLEVVVDIALRCWKDANGNVDEIALISRLPSHAVSAVKRSNWRPLGLILTLGLIVVIFKPGLPYVVRMAGDVLSGAVSGTQEVGELQGLRFANLYAFIPVGLPLLVGIGIAVTRHRKADLLCVGWLLILLFLAVFASRLMLYAAPASCVLCGLGLARIFDLERLATSPRHVSIGMGMVAFPSRRILRICVCAVLGVVLVVLPLVAAYHLGDNGRIAADEEWQAALGFLNEETPPDAVIMSWWDYGYWILDMANRRPVVDNGYYGWDEGRLEDIGRAYCAVDPAEAARVMQEYGAEYLVLSRWEVTILPVITTHGLGQAYGDGLSVPDELKESLFYRSLYQGFEEGGGLSRIYPSSDVAEPEVVILKRSVTASPLNP